MAGILRDHHRRVRRILHGHIQDGDEEMLQEEEQLAQHVDAEKGGLEQNSEHRKDEGHAGSADARMKPANEAPMRFVT